MEKVKKTTAILGRLKWLGLVFGTVMCVLTQPRFGDVLSVILGAAAGIGFIFICENEKKNIICDHVADHLHGALEKEGYGDCVFEIKLMKPGMIIRIYTINYGGNAMVCNDIIVRQISRSWYRDSVWITQVVDVKDEDEIENARMALDDELLEDLKKMKDERKKNGKGQGGEK